MECKSETATLIRTKLKLHYHYLVIARPCFVEASISSEHTAVINQAHQAAQPVSHTKASGTNHESKGALS
jgi:hypothetical protein